jgi:tRNA (cytidine32/uridine32-2'-O)-methyltransferase
MHTTDLKPVDPLPADPTPADPSAGYDATGSTAPLSRVRFVLVEPSLSANVGAVARAMKTMGLTELVLVRPRQALDAEAMARAAGADDLLQRARICDSLAEALAGCRLVIGSSARARSLSWPELNPAGCAEQLLNEAATGEVALLLGRERSGLTNDELSHCHFLTRIETNPDYSSLNIAAAAQVFAYELRRTALHRQSQASAAGQPSDAAEQGAGTEALLQASRADLATADEMASFYGHLEQTLAQIGFADPAQSATLRLRLRRLFNRARPDRTELNILRGILSAVEGRKGAARSAR